MNPRITLAFVVVFALLAGGIYAMDQLKIAPPASGQPTPIPEVQVFQFDDRRATAFVGRSGDKTVRFEKEGESNWKIAGTEEAANRLSVSSLVIRMSTLKGTRRVGDTVDDLRQYGLAEPKFEMTTELDDGSTYGLQMGDKTPVGTGAYAKKSDASEIYVIASQLQTDLERLVNDPKEPPTPTPRPTSTPTPTPTPGGATATPTATATGTS